MGKHHDNYGSIDDDTDGNGLENHENFDGFQDNEDVAREAEEAYMDALNKITGRGNDVYRLLMG